MLTIDPELFLDSAISDETRAFNENLLAESKTAPDAWSFTPMQLRQARKEGKGVFPAEPVEPTARNIEIEAHGNALGFRIFRPRTLKPLGTFLHIHGGGWQVGSALGQDMRLQEVADRCALTCISVDYRLAPEHPYPAGPDDCEAAALWLLKGDHEFNTDYLCIGGESAGAHLTVSTLLRLRSKNVPRAFDAAVLTAGVYDLGQTASSKNWGDDKLILASRDMHIFASGYLHNGEDTRSPAISPLYAALSDLPPALFSVGTKDLLLDDTLMMATRWHAANGNAELDVTPGGCHVFQSMRHLEIAKASNAKIDDFVNKIRIQRYKAGK